MRDPSHSAGYRSSPRPRVVRIQPCVFNSMWKVRKGKLTDHCITTLLDCINWGRMDVNLALAGLLFDLAFLAGENQRAWGYKRAAKAVLRLDQQITPLVQANTFRAVAGIGPTTDRIA